MRRNRAARRALGVAAWQAVAAIVIGGNLAVLLLVGVQRISGQRVEAHVILGVLGAVAIAAPLALHRVLIARRRRWLELYDLPLDRESYLEALDVVRSGETLQIDVRLQGALPASAVPEIRGARVEAIAERLLITAPARRRKRSLHLWFRELTDLVLRPIGRAHVINEITARRVSTRER